MRVIRQLRQRWRTRREAIKRRKAWWRYAPGGDKYPTQDSPAPGEPCRHDRALVVEGMYLCLDCEEELPYGWDDLDI